MAARHSGTASIATGRWFISAGSPGQHIMAALRQSLAEAGYVDGRNVAIEFHLAEGRYDRLPMMVAELVRRQVAVIVAGPTPAALAAKAATQTIPILFGVTDDPVKLGLVASFARPGGNVTGVNFVLAEFGLSAKRLGLLRELVPQATRIAALVNPNNAETAEAVTRDVMAAASTIGAQIEVIHASDSQEIEAAFATFVRNRADALLVGTNSVLAGSPTCHVGNAPCDPCRIHRTRVSGCWWSDELWNECEGRCMAARCYYAGRILRGREAG